MLKNKNNKLIFSTGFAISLNQIFRTILGLAVGKSGSQEDQFFWSQINFWFVFLVILESGMSLYVGKSLRLLSQDEKKHKKISNISLDELLCFATSFQCLAFILALCLLSIIFIVLPDLSILTLILIIICTFSYLGSQKNLTILRFENRQDLANKILVISNLFSLCLFFAIYFVLIKLNIVCWKTIIAFCLAINFLVQYIFATNNCLKIKRVKLDKNFFTNAYNHILKDKDNLKDVINNWWFGNASNLLIFPPIAIIDSKLAYTISVFQNIINLVTSLINFRAQALIQKFTNLVSFGKIQNCFFISKKVSITNGIYFLSSIAAIYFGTILLEKFKTSHSMFPDIVIQILIFSIAFGSILSNPFSVFLRCFPGDPHSSIGMQSFIICFIGFVLTILFNSVFFILLMANLSSWFVGLLQIYKKANELCLRTKHP